MLCKLYRRTYVGPPDICYFLEYPLINTWTYEVSFGLLGKNHRMYASLVGRPLLFMPINTPYPFRFLHKLKMPLGYQSVLSVFCECWWSVCVFRNVREAELLRFCFKEVTFDL
jgi:hypothetical protein